MSTPQKHSVLIVDDEPDILLSLRGLLRREFTLHTAETGADALAVLAEHPIHVIMTDQRMPGMTGAELMGKVRTQYPDAIRIIFTGYSDIKAVIELINTGGLFRYLTKPWDPDELVEVLHHAAVKYEELVERRQLLRDLHDYFASETQLIRDLESLPPQWNAHHEIGTALKERVERLMNLQAKRDGRDAP